MSGYIVVIYTSISCLYIHVYSVLALPSCQYHLAVAITTTTHTSLIHNLQCRRVLKLTSGMMSPENFSVVDPVNLVAVTLSPREDTGLVRSPTHAPMID